VKFHGLPDRKPTGILWKKEAGVQRPPQFHPIDRLLRSLMSHPIAVISARPTRSLPKAQPNAIAAWGQLSRVGPAQLLLHYKPL